MEALFLLSIGRIAMSAIVADFELGKLTVISLVLISLSLSLVLRFYLNQKIASTMAGYLQEIRMRISDGITRSLHNDDVKINSSTVAQEMGAISLEMVRASRDIFEGIVGGITLLTFGVAAFIAEPLGSLFGTVLLGGALLLLQLLKSRFAMAASNKVGSDQLMAAKFDGLLSLKDEIKAHGLQKPVESWSARLIRDASARWREHDVISRNVPLLYVTVMYLMLAMVAIFLVLRPGVGVASLGALSLILLRAQNYGNKLQGGLLSVVQFHETEKFLVTGSSAEQVRVTTSERLLEIESKNRPSTDLLTTSSVLKLENVSFEYVTGAPVVHGVNIEVERGEVVGLVGPSGSGKSTIAKLSAGLISPVTGRVLISGRDASVIDNSERSELISYLPQTPGRIVGSIRENVAMFDERVSSDEIKRALNEVGLTDELEGEDLLEREIGSSSTLLSGGQLQRLLICRWIVRDRPLRILDEPTSALDGINSAHIGALIQTAAATSGVLLITHSENLVPYCDKVITLDGRVSD